MPSKKNKKSLYERNRCLPRRPSVLAGRRVDAKAKHVPLAPVENIIHSTDLATYTNASEDILRVIRGNITEEQYLELRVERALEHVKVRTSPSRLTKLREMLFEQLRVDPVLLAITEQLFGRKNRQGE